MDKAKSRQDYFLRAETACGTAGLTYRVSPFAITGVFLPGGADEKALAGIGIEKAPCDDAKRAVLSLVGYFAGQSPDLSQFLPNLDLSGLTLAQIEVLKATAAIPRGETRSYGELAKAVGRPKAARFVGNVMANNPFPVIIPCHRVVRAGGDIGKFGGGVELKARMLELEKTKDS
ncbi:MAG: methylated-DNA--[protein]-cysteine S-methyltransferase [Deltaproteobacteria bacterium]|nr:methylated-DNA--[protein]-cysteine S-methyltransferase [Deltaproteobacteria bacterium]